MKCEEPRSGLPTLSIRETALWSTGQVLFPLVLITTYHGCPVTQYLLYCQTCFFKDSFIYSKGRVTERKGETEIERPSICWFISQRPAPASAELIRDQEPGTPSGCVTWVPSIVRRLPGCISRKLEHKWGRDLNPGTLVWMLC